MAVEEVSQTSSRVIIELNEISSVLGKLRKKLYKTDKPQTVQESTIPQDLR